MQSKNAFKGIIIVLVLFLSSCYDVQTNHVLSIVNKSKRTITVLYDNDENSDSNENYVAYYKAEYNLIKPHSTWTLTKLGGKDAWHNYIQQSTPQKLFVYVMDLETLKKYNSEDLISFVRDRHEYLKKMAFSEEELAKQNWKIVFNEE